MAVVFYFILFFFPPQLHCSSLNFVCLSFPPGLAFPRFLQDFCALPLDFFLSGFPRCFLLLQFGFALFFFFFPLVIQSSEHVKAAGRVAEYRMCCHLFWVHPSSPIQRTSSSALTSTTTHCQSIPVGSRSWWGLCQSSASQGQNKMKGKRLNKRILLILSSNEPLVAHHAELWGIRCCIHADTGMLEEGMGLCCAGRVFSFRASSLFESKCSEQLG